MVRISTSKFALLCFTIITISTIHLILQCDFNQPCAIVNEESKAKDVKVQKREVGLRSEETGWQKHKLAVLVPFRDRFDELLQFAPWIHKFLNQQKIPHKIIVINQVDSHRFNRAALINVGYLFSREECDYLVMHDVDLLPQNPLLLYNFPEKGPYHLASPEYHPKYHYKTYIGGVLMMTNEQFLKCQGMSNNFWGWGREDDELYMRFRQHNLTLHRPTGLTTGYETFKHVHDKQKRPRDYSRYGDQRKVQFQKDDATGFHNLKYSIEAQRAMMIDSAPVTILDVDLRCDYDVTPWCDHQPDNLKQPQVKKGANNKPK